MTPHPDTVAQHYIEDLDRWNPMVRKDWDTLPISWQAHHLLAALCVLLLGKETQHASPHTLYRSLRKLLLDYIAQDHSESWERVETLVAVLEEKLTMARNHDTFRAEWLQRFGTDGTG